MPGTGMGEVNGAREKGSELLLRTVSHLDAYVHLAGSDFPRWSLHERV